MGLGKKMGKMGTNRVGTRMVRMEMGKEMGKETQMVRKEMEMETQMARTETVQTWTTTEMVTNTMKTQRTEIKRKAIQWATTKLSHPYS